MLRVITTVLEPADSYDLVTLEQVRTEIKLTETDDVRDTALSAFISQVSRGISTYCHRVFVLETVRDEFFLGTSDSFGELSPLALSRYPVKEITAFTQGGEDVGEDAYRLIAVGGRLYRLGTTGAIDTWPSSSAVVEYVAGYEDIPADVQEAALRLITMRFKAWGRDPMLIQQDQPNLGSQRWWVGGQAGQNGAYPPEIAGLLEDYVIPTLA